MLVRSSGLAESMSRYLIRRIEENPAIVLRHAHRDRRARRGATISSACAGATIRRGERRDPRHPARLRHDRRRAQHAAGSRAASRSTPRDSSRRGRICRRTIWPPRIGRSPGRPISSKRVCPECSRSATCAAATSNAWRRRSARDRSRSPSSIRCCTNRRERPWPDGTCAHIDAITTVKHAKRRQCEECVKIGARWVHLRTCQECGATLLLRRLAEPACHQARAGEQASGDRLGGARRTLVVLLSG